MRRLLLALCLLLLGVAAGAQDFIRYYPTQIGTTSAGAFTFTGPILLPDGTVAAPSAARAVQPGTGMYFAADTVKFGVAGTNTLNIGNSFISFPPNNIVIYMGATLDLSLGRKAAATLQMGDNAAAAVTPQILQAAASTGAGNAGATLTLRGGTPGAGGTQGNVNIDAPAITGYKTTSFTDNTLKAFVLIAVPADDYVGGEVVYTLYCKDAADQVIRSGVVSFAGQAKGTTATCPATLTTYGFATADISNNAKAFTTAPFTCRGSATAGNNLIQLELQPDCTIAAATDIHLDWQIIMTKPQGVLPQT